MGKRIVWIGACALIGLLVAFAGMSSARTTPQNTNGGGNANANSAGGHGHSNKGGSAANANTGPSASDRKFAAEAAMGGMAEVEMGRLGVERATSEDVKAFSQRLIDDHTKANEELTQIASTKGVTLPTSLDAKHQAMIAHLRSLSGAAFEREFAHMGVKDHREDIKAFQKEAARGGDADIKGFAARALPTLQEHLRMAEAAEARMKGAGGAHSNMNMNGNSNRGGNSNNSNNGNRR